MTEDADFLKNEVVRLNKIVRVLMDRAESSTNLQGSDFSLFQATIMLDAQVQGRTAELEAALQDNARMNRDLLREREEQRVLIKKLADAHTQLLQSEKLASVGQLAAGVAHEINNPIGFVISNLHALKDYVNNLLVLLDRYAAVEPTLPAPMQRQLADARLVVDLDFMRQDVVALLDESVEGAARVQRIVQGLRDFARPEKNSCQTTDLHAGLESALSVVSGHINHKVDLVREYGHLPPVECFPSQINQVFLNILLNAAQAIPDRGIITIRTAHDGEAVSISISDTGTGMTPEIAKRVFDPFFTTRPVGQGAGLGLSMAYGIMESHRGQIKIASEPGKGSTFTIRLPLKQRPA